MRKRVTLYTVSLATVIAFSSVLYAYTPGPPISSMTGGNKHNLSSLNSAVNYKAENPSDPRSNQICIYCHTPHNAVSKDVLWNRHDPTKTFGHYSSPTLVIDDPDVRALSQYGEPNGSSRLCLSCHDGETALGAVANGPPISFPAQYTKVAMLNISSHHPVSFVYNNDVLLKILSKRPTSEEFKLPPAVSPVKLDSLQRMQCTACHDPHQNWADHEVQPTPPFWVAPTHDEVCLTCHALDAGPVGKQW